MGLRLRKLWNPWLLGTPLVLGWTACDFEGIRDIGETVLSPDAALIDRPGTRLVSGRFFGAEFGFSELEGPRLVAFEAADSNSDSNNVVIVSVVESYFEGSHCDAGPADGKYVLWGNEENPGFVALHDEVDEEGLGSLRIVGYDCTELAHFESARLPVLRTATDVSDSLIVHRGDDSLVEIDDFDTGKKNVIAENVVQTRVTDDGLWSVEDQRLVFRAAENDVLVDFGSEVTRMWGRPGSASDIVYRDQGALYRVAVAEDGGVNEVRLQPDACEPRWNGNILTYFAPCESRRLVLQVFEPALDGKGNEYGSVEFVGPENTAPGDRFTGHAEILELEEGEPGAVFFVESGDSEVIQEGRLHYALLPGESALPSYDGSEFLPEVDLDTKTFRDDVQLKSGVPFAGHDGEKGTLLRFVRPDVSSSESALEISDLVPAMEGVTHVWTKKTKDIDAPWVGIGRVGEGLGVLFAMGGPCEATPCPEPKVLAENIPPQFVPRHQDTGRVFAVGQVEDGLGRIYVDAPRPTEDTPNNLPLWAGKQVRPDSLRFLSEPDGVAYLSGSTSGPADLRVYLAESDLDVSVHPDVSWFWAPGFPSDGILYQVESGEDAGIWFAKAR